MKPGTPNAILEPETRSFYHQMLRIRRFEERVLDWFPRGVFFGTTHTYIGQEADAVGVMGALAADDIVVSNHRCHGHFLAYGGSMEALAGELMGRTSGVAGGRGGSQHVQWRSFYANGILGGTLPLAAGMALAEKAKQSENIVVAFTGDGAMGEGVIYETLNMVALWGLPLLIVLENNLYAQSTPIHLNLAGSLEARFTAFGLPAQSLDTTDVEEIHTAAEQCVRLVRAGEGPRVLLLKTYRFAPHSKGDDTRDPAEIAERRARDPLPLQANRLAPEVVEDLKSQVDVEVEDAFEAALAAPLASPSQLGSPWGTAR